MSKCRIFTIFRNHDFEVTETLEKIVEAIFLLPPHLLLMSKDKLYLQLTSTSLNQRTLVKDTPALSSPVPLSGLKITES